MIYLYSGTPGSGKSLHSAYDIWANLRTYKRKVICNFDINVDALCDRRHKKADIESRLTVVDNQELTVKFLRRYARKNHKYKGEFQTLLIIDECANKFNPREFQRGDRNEWVTFFLQHRKLGFDIILITQGDRLIDRQIRLCIEIERQHLAMRNYKTFGWILTLFFGKMFVYTDKWYCARMFLGRGMFRLNKKKAKIYDTFMFFDEEDFDDD